MSKIANVALTNTFDYWRTRSNESFDRLSQFAINNSKLYANTVVANNVLRALGNTVLGVAGKRAVINGRLDSNGSVTVTSNITASGNTTTNKLSVTSRAIVSGNTVLGGSGKRTIANGKFDANGYATVTGRFDVSGNTNLGGAGKRTNINGVTQANGTVNVTDAFRVSGNTILGKTIVNGNFTGNGVATFFNVTISANTKIAGLLANNSLGAANYVLKTNGTTIFWAPSTGGASYQGSSIPVITVTGNSTFGAAGKHMVVTGLLTANGRVVVGTNITVTGNTSTNKATVTSSLTVSGNTSTNKATVTTSLVVSGNSKFGASGKKSVVEGTFVSNGVTQINNSLISSGNNVLGAAGKKTVINGTSVANGYLTVTNRFDVSGNTNLGGSGKKTVVNGTTVANGTLSVQTNLTVTGNTSANKETVTSLLTVSGNTVLGAAGKTQTSTGAWSHTGRMTVSTNFTASGNAQVLALGVGTAPGTNGSIRAIENVTAYYSDERLKIKIGPITNPLDKIMNLNGFYFTPNQRALDLGYKMKRDVGVSAQEVLQVLPEIITEAPIDPQYMTVYYEKLIPLLIEGIKALTKRVEILEGR